MFIKSKLLPTDSIIDTGIEISRSAIFMSEDSDYMSRTFSASNSRKWSLSFWVKRSGYGVNETLLACWQTSGINEEAVYFTLGQLIMYDGLAATILFLSDEFYRDVAGWYHIVLVYDSANATANDRFRAYVNGVRASGTVNISLNRNSYINAYARPHTIGRLAGIASNYLDGYIAEYHFLDGIAADPNDFGYFSTDTGEWVADNYTGSYGTNGFYLNFTNGSNLGEDFSGNNNDWSNGGASISQDTPSNNACTFNYLIEPLSRSPLYFAATRAKSAVGASQQTRGTFQLNSGKYYWETSVSNVLANVNNYTGVASIGIVGYYYATNGQYYDGSSWTAYGSTYTSGDKIGIAIDIDNGTLEFFKNNVSQGQKSITPNIPYVLRTNIYSTGNGYSLLYALDNIQTYTPPSGYLALTTTNLPALDGPFATYSNCTAGDEYSSGTYTGNGNADGPFVYLGYAPSQVCINSTAYAPGSTVVDFLCNGFKIRSTSSAVNTNSTSYSYKAWVDADFKYARARPNGV